MTPDHEALELDPQPGAARRSAAALAPHTEMGRLVAGHSWSTTPLGPIDTWPENLLTAAGICLSSRFPMLLCWGPDLRMIYNDGYLELLGRVKHASALGRPVRDVWPEIWDVIEPMFAGVQAGGSATWSEDQLLVVDRSGFLEDAYFTWTFAPVHGPDGGVEGVLDVVVESTDTVLAERRARVSGELVLALAGAQDEEQVRAAVRQTMGSEPADHLSVDLVSGARPPADQPAADQPAAARAGTRWVAVHEPGVAEPAGHLVLEPNPRRPWDARLQAYVEVCASHVATALAALRRLEHERGRARALADLDAARTTFFANMSHELRTPLTLISGPAHDALEDTRTPLPPVHRERFALVERNSRSLVSLVDRLLDLTRLEAGVVRPHPVPTDVTAVTRGLAEGFRPAVRRAGLRLAESCAPLPDTAYLDPEMYERIVLNLLSNAVKFTAEGSISIDLRATARGFEISVCDTGVGIARDDAERIFERFHQLPQAPGGWRGGGAGIGLSLTRQLVDLMGGTIAVESTPGTGSTFRVELPMRMPDPRPETADGLSISRRPLESFVDEVSRMARDAAAHGRTASAASEGGSVGARTGAAGDPAYGLRRPPVDGARKPRLLVVEDHPDLRTYLVDALADEYDVVATGDGIQALDAVRTRRPDLVVADVMMPRLDGPGLVRELRQDPATADLPIVLLSARAGAESRVSGLDGGADDYLVKPFDLSELRARLGAVLRRAVDRSRDNAWRQAIVASLAEPLIITDRDGTVLQLNDAFTRTFGWSLDDGPLAPPYPWQLGPTGEPGGQSRTARRLRLLADGESIVETFRLRRRDGTCAWVELTATLVPESGEHPAFIVGVARDVSREREARERRERAAALARELADAVDLEHVVVAAVAGFSVLFDGVATVRVTLGDTDLLFTPDGLSELRSLPPRIGELLSVQPQPALAPSVGGERDHARAGLLLAPVSEASTCRVWVQFRAVRQVGVDEAIVGDLLAQTFTQAVDRVVARQDHETKQRQLQQAIESHRFIGQAVGVLIERHKVTAVEGFDMLRQASLNRNVKLREIAARVVESGQEPMQA